MIEDFDFLHLNILTEGPSGPNLEGSTMSSQGYQSPEHISGGNREVILKNYFTSEVFFYQSHLHYNEGVGSCGVNHFIPVKLFSSKVSKIFYLYQQTSFSGELDAVSK